MNLYMIPFQTKKANGDNLFCGEVEKLGDWVLCMPNTYIVRTNMTSKEIRDFLLPVAHAAEGTFLVASIQHNLHGLLEHSQRWDELEHIVAVTTD